MSSVNKLQPFFIVGSDRSGTTMFQIMLNAHSKLYLPKESWFMSDLLDSYPVDEVLNEQSVTEVIDLVTSHWRWKEWNLDSDELSQLIEKLSDPKLSDLIQTIFNQSLSQSGKVRWGDKTPGYVTEIDRIHKLFPNAKFVHLIRDGRDVNISLKRTRWRGDATWDIAKYWADSVEQGCSQGRQLPSELYMELSYETLVVDTENSLRKVCDFLNEDFELPMLDFYKVADKYLPKNRDTTHLAKTKRPPSKSDIQRWKNEMSSLQIFIFECIAGKVMKEVGQQTYFPSIIRIFAPVFSLVTFLSEKTLPLRKILGLHFSKSLKKL